MEGSAEVPGASRYDEIRDLFASGDDDVDDLMAAPERLCHAVVTRLHAAGAVVTLRTAGLGPQIAAATDPRSNARSALQLTTGEGPCADAPVEHRPVLVADLDAVVGRWPG